MGTIMTASSPPRRRSDQRGTSLIEVLVTVIVLATGLLGIAGLQSRLQVSEMEAYQRAQAMILVADMSHRLAASRASAADYVTGASQPVGGGTCAADNANRAETDLREWCEALNGAAEKSGTSDVGAMIGGRGCIEQVTPNEYMITVAWQGMVPLAAPATSVACGKNLYNGTGGCTGDMCRRAVTTVVKIAPL